MTITIQKCKDYTNPLDCGIVKGLRKKFIFAIVGPKKWCGLFLGFIPVWGTIPKTTNDFACYSDNFNFIPKKAKINLFK